MKKPNKRKKEISERLKEHLISIEQVQTFIEVLEVVSILININEE